MSNDALWEKTILTKLVKREDHTRDGQIDWQSYEDAQVGNGERCYNCLDVIVHYTGNLTCCPKCVKLAQNRGAVEHTHRIRCPHCRNEENVAGKIDRSKLHPTDIRTDVCCSKCGKTYPVEVEISYVFRSPEVKRRKNAKESAG